MENTKKAVPFIKTGQAIQSLRFSGYTLEAAIAEVIDNSIEAKSNNIRVYLVKPEGKKNKIQVSEIAIVDDGDGMTTEQLHLYPQIGYSSRYMREDTIGKYGVGAKLAALSVATRFDVWSRNDLDKDWFHVYLDLDEMMKLENEDSEIIIHDPKPFELPGEISGFLEGSTGTAVVWSSIDALEDGRLAGSFDELRSNLEKELSRMFRYFIEGGINIFVNDKKLLAFDPLYLIENSYNDIQLKSYYKNLNQTEQIKDHYKPTVIADETIKVGPSLARLKITLYPKELVRRRGLGGDELSRKLQLPENEGSISFIRMNREVSYTNVPKIFHRGVEEADRFIGIEVSFSPNLDSYFGVRNVKRGVEPHGELRKDIREKLKKYLKTARTMLDEIWGKVEKENKTKHGEHNSLIKAVKEVNITMPKGVAKGPEKQKEEQILDDLAKDVTGEDVSETKETYLNNIKDLPFVLESVDYPGDQFMDIKHLSNQVIIRLNTRHKFYREMWEPVKLISEREPSSVTPDEAIAACKRTIEALTLLLITYGKAESMDPQPDEKYRDLTNYWGGFLNTMMGKVKNIL